VSDEGLPPGFRLSIEARLERDGTLLLGGEPFALVRLTEADAASVAAWRAGAPVGDDPGARRLARALVARNLAQPVPPPASGPAVSAVIPAHDPPVSFERLLAALRATPEVCQIVVVDDGSADPGAVRRAAAGAELVRHDRPRGPGASRNAGLTRATEPIVAFVDADCVPRPGWLAAVLPHFQDPAVALVAPRVVPHTEPPGGAVARYESSGSPLDRGPARGAVHPGGRVPFLPGATLVARRSALGTGFDERLPGGEDVELVWRLGARYEPAGVVEHHQAGDLRGWLRRRFGYGRSAARLARLHPGGARPLAISPWTAAAWAAVAARRPLAGAAVLGVASALLARRLHRLTGDPAWALRTATALAGGGSLRAGEAVAAAFTRTWAPASSVLAVAVPRARLPLAAAALIPPLLDERTPRSAAGLALRLADDAAYGLGVWVGCALERTWVPLRPDMGWTLTVIPSINLGPPR
jgi:mycofactocin system glycosyltransferase